MTNNLLKHRVTIGAFVLAVISVVLASILFLSLKEQERFFMNGFESGFDISGYYRLEKDNRTTVSFLADSENAWQLVDGDTQQNGTFERTDDPNIYVLYDQAGKEYGLAHLAFASRSGEEGSLYLIHHDKTMVFGKTNPRPAFVETAK